MTFEKAIQKTPQYIMLKTGQILKADDEAFNRYEARFFKVDAGLIGQRITDAEFCFRRPIPLEIQEALARMALYAHDTHAQYDGESLTVGAWLLENT